MNQVVNQIVEMITKANGVLNDFIWGPFMLVLLVGTGVYLTFRTGFFQISKFGTVMKNTIGTLFSRKKKDKSDQNLTPFQAVSTALAGTIGVGNIAGIATAIVMGGPGAIFWMWISAFFGMMTKYAEVVLSIKFRETNEKGQHIGGPMYYIEKGLHMKWLACIFAVLCTLASFGIGNMTQSNTIADAVQSNFQIPPYITGVVIAVIAGLVIIGGIKRIGKVTSAIVPFMAIFYLIGCIIVLVTNIGNIPSAFGMIFEGAFDFSALAGGVGGYVIMNAMRYGIARGVFSNEAGLGSAPIAHAASNTREPVKQGMWGVFEVFIDTIVTCTFTALVILTSGLWDGGKDGAALTTAAFTQHLGSFGGMIVTIAIIFFALSTILGWSYYGERSLGYLSKDNQVVLFIYRVIFIFFIVVGSTMKLDLVWNIADTLNGMMAIPNLVALIGLSGVVIKLTKDYRKRMKEERRS
ncbi:alanine/glycine:cation symporter family protein [Candidatus Soleaferrea massiliensis]|uniref:alanine/glycine:cation symporter family protein n=1 Tax=Candidatus Soleaferrea massiliensis TaxID=1470354 RepID=UPI000A3F382C|nr:sodium:alanine symporter family protein [Candidatus Soleaferrea massiliensis]